MKVFLSSTCYDLTDLRARLEKYLASKGHQPILSDRATFPVTTNVHRHDACLAEVKNAQLFVMVIDKRWGAEYYKDPSISITWAEMREALAHNISTIAFVRRSVYDERLTWKKNKESIKPAHCDNEKTFRIIDEIQTNTGIWCQPFDNVEDIVTQLEVIGGIKTGDLSAAPTSTPDAGTSGQLPIGRLSERVRRFMLSTIDQSKFTGFVTREQVDRCLTLLPETPQMLGIIMDFEISDNQPNGIYFDHAIRPADDDGSSWYVARGLTATGHAIRQELLKVKELLGKD